MKFFAVALFIIYVGFLKLTVGFERTLSHEEMTTSLDYQLVTSRWHKGASPCGVLKPGIVNVYRSKLSDGLVNVIHYCPSRFSDTFFVEGNFYRISTRKKKVVDIIHTDLVRFLDVGKSEVLFSTAVQKIN